MFLDRIDIDAHGPLNRVELGPFSEQLNVICGPEGSGKTAIARFIRDSLVDREYPLGMMSSSTGRVVWADEHGLLHCRREQDGTPTGRRSVQFDPRGDFVDRYHALHKSWISGAVDVAAETGTARSIQIPESIVDGVITDTAVTSVARVVSACLRSGLDQPDAIDSPTVHDRTGPNEDQHRRALRAQLADVEAELASLRVSDSEYSTLIDRRNELTSRLAGGLPNQHASLHPHPADLQRRINRLRLRQKELRQAIADLERRTTATPFQRNATAARHADETLGRKLDDLDAQIIRWRRTLTEVHALRDALSRYVSHESYRHGTAAGPLEDVVTRRRRLNGLLHAAGRYDANLHWDSYRDSYGDEARPLSSADIDVRIDAATRQIDWLLQRYVSGDHRLYNWHQGIDSFYGGHATVAETLQAIRRDLAEVRQRTRRPITHPGYEDHHSYPWLVNFDELRECERWLAASIDQLIARRESLFSASHAPAAKSRVPGRGDAEDVRRERLRRIHELDRVTWELNELSARAAESGSEAARHANPPRWYDDIVSEAWSDREALVEEIRQIDDRLARLSRAKWLRTRRSQLLRDLGTPRHPAETSSPLAEHASRWLIRLSAGRLRRVAWPYAAFKSASLAHSIHLDSQRTGVCIDGRDESDCPAADRALAVLAVRMAAGDALARSGRPVPLVLETHRELLQAIDLPGQASAAAYDHGYRPGSYGWSTDGRSNHPICTALHDYTRAGRQVILMTSNQVLANQITRDGGRCFQLLAQRTVHPHRPIWRAQYAAERYVGPHPHTYGAELAPESHGNQYVMNHQQPNGSRPRPVRGIDDVNRNFDMAWREAYGLDDHPDRRHPLPATDWAPDGIDFRDGYYVTDAFTTNRPSAKPADAGRDHVAITTQRVSQPHQQRPASPFFLSVDSPIDQAPSIDAVAAARLRGLKITHVNHLMQQDSNRLADALGLADVDASTIRRWQSECRLCCRVPNLRGFDSRILVGCGVNDPAHLASIHPVNLLEQVESFLATEAGNRILRTGSSHELSRITGWIASARSANADRNSNTLGAGRVVNGRVVQKNQPQYGFDSDRYEYESESDQQSGRRTRENSVTRSPRNKNRGRYGIRLNGDPRDNRGTGNGSGSGIGSGSGSGIGSGSGSGNGSGSGSGNGPGSGNGSGAGNGSGTGRGRNRRSARRGRNVVRMEQQGHDSSRDQGDRQSARQRRQRSKSSRSTSSSRQQRAEQDSTQELRFFLQRDSPVADAPSIGSRMAERLNDAGIVIVDDLINADPETLAAELDHRRVDADTIQAWQDQSTLVCRIPMLRGHDAQLLVAAEITTTEEVAESDPEELFSLIDPISRSSQGKRIIRGGKKPDLDEIKDWIRFAGHNRDLLAA